MTFGPPAKFCKILISRLIFFFLTGLRTLTIHFWLDGRWIDSNTCWVPRVSFACDWDEESGELTSEYFPRPTLRTIS